MAGVRIIKYAFACLCAGVLFSWTIRVCLCQSRQTTEQVLSLGELKLEGSHIQRLILRRKDGKTEKFNQPSEIIKLPAGQYRLMESHLEGGYTCFASISDKDWITVTQDKQAVLKVGAPLTKTLDVKRQGRVLQLNYKLLGIGGESYTNTDRSKPPTFTIYKGNKEIASGKFEFGWGGICRYSWRVPLTAYGELKIVPSADIGDLGTKESSAVVYDWKWYYNVSALGLWLLLVLSIVLVKANRKPQSLLILVPLLIVSFLWSIFKRAMSMPSSQTETFDMLFFSLTVGIAILWLLSHKLGNRNRIVTFFLALIIMAVVGLAGAVSYAGLEFTQQAAGALILFGILILAMLLAFVLTAWRCRKRYSNLRFMLYLAVWTVAACLGITILFYSIVFIVAWAHISISTALLMVSVIGLALSVFLYVIIFPFMILALRSTFYRERFFACLRLKPLPVASGDENSRPDEISVT